MMGMMMSLTSELTVEALGGGSDDGRQVARVVDDFARFLVTHRAGEFGGGGGAMLPFADTLAEKLGISPQMANMLIMGAIGLLTASMAKKQSGRSVDLAGVTDSDYIRSSGVASRLSAQMGISEDDAVYGLQEAMGLMATQAGASAAKPKKAAAKKTTAKKATADQAAPQPAKKTTHKKSKTTPKKSSTSDTGSDFMDLLDDPR